MVKPTRLPANGFVAGMRKVYNPLGFSKGYNFVLWFIAVGYIFGFTLSRLEYLSFYGIFCNPNSPAGVGASPGECYYYLQNPWKIGIQLHLYCILPAALLVCLQFVPVIRHKLILFHRINGYLVILLSLFASAGALMIAEHAFGGDMSTRTVVGALVISTTVAYLIAYINIKRLQIDQHRAWMMRAWAYFSAIITLRLIMFSSAAIISNMDGWYSVRPCAQVASIVGEKGTLFFYPNCAAFFDGTNPNKEIIVKANFNSANPMEIGASLGIPFGSSGWLAFWLHAIIVELYLRLTPAETDRLKQVSYERQSAKGWKNPGGAGLTSLRFGDSNPFEPESRKRVSEGEEIGMLNDTGRNASHEEDEH